MSALATILPWDMASRLDDYATQHHILFSKGDAVPTLAVTLIKAFGVAAVASIVAIAYAEVLYTGLKALYYHGLLKRYYPLPTNRHLVSNWFNNMSFIGPTTLFAMTWQRGLDRSTAFSPVQVLAHVFLYMVIHDVSFYMIHSTFHYKRFLYNFFHALHHEYVYAMNVYCVGFAEGLENFIQVGLPWVTWTWIAGANWWNWILPLTIVVWTTLVGHSGYRMSPLIAVFHPLIIPVIALTGKFMLNPGDHQVHHTHRRYNYGLFWRLMDKYYGTYRKCDVRAYDVHFWKKWQEAQTSNSEESKKWLGRHNVEFTEVAWGF